MLNYQELLSQLHSPWSLSEAFQIVLQNPIAVGTILTHVQSLPTPLPPDERDKPDDASSDSSEEGSPTRSSFQNSTYQLKPLRQGRWQGIVSLMRHPQEGFISLFKGLPLLLITEPLKRYLQQTIEDQLNEYFDLYDLQVLPLEDLPRFWPNIGTVVAAHTLSSLILSPFYNAYVRLAVQSADPLRRSYVGLWFPSENWVLRLSISAIKSLFRTTLSLILTQIFKLKRPGSEFGAVTDKDLVFWTIGTFSILTLESLITTPLTILCDRRCLYMKQSKETKKSIRYPCVSMPDTIPNSLVSHAVSIVSSESIFNRYYKHIGWLGGIAQLYRGFWLDLASNLMQAIVEGMLKSGETTQRMVY